MMSHAEFPICYLNFLISGLRFLFCEFLCFASCWWAVASAGCHASTTCTCGNPGATSEWSNSSEMLGIYHNCKFNFRHAAHLRHITDTAGSDSASSTTPASESDGGGVFGSLSSSLRKAAVTMLGGVDDRDSEHIHELNILRTRVVTLTDELRSTKGALDDVNLRLAAADRIDADQHGPAAPAVQPSALSKVHPTFGELVKDFGYKQVYAVRLDQLIDPTTFPVWEKQRAYRHTRAKKIATAMAKSNSPFPGVISVFQHEDNHAIIDGQHRVGALRELKEAGVWSADASILLEVHQVNSRAEVDKLFVDINKAEPLSLVDLPGVATPAVKSILDEAVAQLQQQYPSMFSESRRCRVPHINGDKLRDDLFQSGLIERHGLESADDLLQWLNQVNEELFRQRDRWEGKLDSPAFAKALEKATSHHFFLGLDRTWLDL